MSRSKLIKQLKEKNSKLNQSEIENLIDIFSESVTDSLKKGRPVEIRGLGRWYCKKLKEKNEFKNYSFDPVLIAERISDKIKQKASQKKILTYEIKWPGKFLQI